MTLNQPVIKQCSYCRKRLTATDFVYDPSLRPIGVIASEDSDRKAYYVFQHDLEGCGSSILIPVELLNSYLLENEAPPDERTPCESCECHCVNLGDLSECRQECHNAPYRRLLIWMLSIRGMNPDGRDRESPVGIPRVTL